MGSPRSRPEALAIVAWAAHLPDGPPPSEVAAWLLDRAPAPPLRFEPEYPLPSPKEFLIPPASLRAIDIGQIIALRLFRTVSDRIPGLLDDLRPTTGVIAGQCGPTPAQIQYTLRCHLDAARRARPGIPDADWERLARRIRSAIPPTGKDAMIGALTNTIASRVANYFDLHGPTLAVDVGLDSGRAGLRIAQLYFDTGALDAAFICAVNGRSLPKLSQVMSETMPSGCALAEGGFGVLATRLSTARARGWPVLTTMRAGKPDPRGPIPRPSALTGRTYLGADSLVPVIEGCLDSDLTSWTTAPPQSPPAR